MQPPPETQSNGVCCSISLKYIMSAESIVKWPSGSGGGFILANDKETEGYLSFHFSVNTIVNKTMEDTLATVKMYETARIEVK